MRNIFIIHGSYGNPQENWFPWLKNELEKLGHRVFVPQFPIPKMQDKAYSGHSLSKWLKEFEKYHQFVNQKTIIIAHSRGCIFTYNLLPTLKNSIDCLFLIAPWKIFRWYPKNWNKIDSFHKKPFAWNKIRQKAKHIEIYQSTNDVIPMSDGKDIAKLLKAKLVTVKNADHFSASYDKKFKKFPLLLENIKKRL